MEGEPADGSPRAPSSRKAPVDAIEPRKVRGARPRPRTLLLALVLASGAGCHSAREARFVYRDGEGGVIGIPKNTDAWPYYYRSQARRQMKDHFPDGYLVVREVEVPLGQTTTFDGQTQAGQVGASRVIGLLGRRARNHGVQSSQHLTEAHIFYVKNDPASHLASGIFARSNTYTPMAYDGPVSERLAEFVQGEGPDAERQEIAASYTGITPPRPTHPSPASPPKLKRSSPADLDPLKPIEAPGYIPDAKPEDWMKLDPAPGAAKARPAP